MLEDNPFKEAHMFLFHINQHLYQMEQSKSKTAVGGVTLIRILPSKRGASMLSKPMCGVEFTEKK